MWATAASARRRTSSWTAAAATAGPEGDLLRLLRGVLSGSARWAPTSTSCRRWTPTPTRSYNFNEVEHFSEGRNARSSAYALNYSCPFVPFPWPPIGKVDSGILTTSDFAVEGGTAGAHRPALPLLLAPADGEPQALPAHNALRPARQPRAELVAVNLHLEAI